MTFQGSVAVHGNRSEWPETVLRSFLRQTDRTGEVDLPLLGVGLHAGVRERDNNDGRPAASEDLSGYKIVKAGDVVMNRLGKPHGSVGVSPAHGITSPAYWVMEIDRNRAYPPFVHHLLRSKHMVREYERLGKYMPPNQFDISWDAFRSIEVPLPPLDEQRRIADFLDAETARIEQLMSGQLRVLDLLEERANSRILDLIGQSTLVKRDGATIVPMRRVIMKLNRPVIPTDEIITAFRDGQVTSRSIRRSEGYTLAASAEPQGQGVEVGDIVVHGLDGFAGAIGDSEACGNCSPVYHVCIPIDGGNSVFYGRLIRLLALSDYLAPFGASARERAVDFRNWKIFGHAPIPQAEPALQHKIANLITKTRPLREEVEHFNERLTERRQVLITAVVTGQIDVTTAQGVAV